MNTKENFASAGAKPKRRQSAAQNIGIDNRVNIICRFVGNWVLRCLLPVVGCSHKICIFTANFNVEYVHNHEHAIAPL